MKNHTFLMGSTNSYIYASTMKMTFCK